MNLERSLRIWWNSFPMRSGCGRNGVGNAELRIKMAIALMLAILLQNRPSLLY